MVFFRFLKKEGAIKADPTLLLQGGKIWQKIPTVLTKEEIKELVLAHPPTDFANKLALAIILLLYASGLRVSELCSLDITDVAEDNLRVVGKGGKERIVPVAKAAIIAIDDYLSMREDKEKALFVSKKLKRLQRNDVFLIIKEGGRRASIQKSISPHSLRHSFATHMVENKADLRVIQELMGHSDIATTERYLHISKGHLKQSFDAFHPR